jgi:hypothetical protein
VDAVAPALIGIGIWLAYEAWTNADPTPLAKFTAALGVSQGSNLTAPGTTATPQSNTNGLVGGNVIRPGTAG